MTKKDYILIANAIKETNAMFEGIKPEIQDAMQVYFKTLMVNLLPRLHRDNPRFDEIRFNEYINNPLKIYKERTKN